MNAIILSLTLISAASATEQNLNKERRHVTPTWTTIELAQDGATGKVDRLAAKQQAVEATGLVSHPVPEREPLVAIPQPDGSYKIEHRPRPNLGLNPTQAPAEEPK